MKRPAILALALLLAAVAWFGWGALRPPPNGTERAAATGAGTQAGTSAAAPEKPFAVEVVEARPVTHRPVLILSAHTEATQVLTVRARVAGEVLETPQREGARVAAGAVLCRLDETTQRADLAAARAALASAERDVKAARRLFARGTLPEAQLKKAEAAFERARARLRQAALALAWRVIRAPVAGVLHRQVAKRGDILSPGAPCAVVARLDPLKVVARASEREVADLSVGMAVRVVIGADTTLRGRLSYIAPVGEAATRTFVVKAEVPNADMTLRAGRTARLEIPLAAREAFRLPLSALVLADDGRLGVHVADASDTVRFVPLTILEEGREAVLAQGLEPGARVIVTGQYFVAPGRRVRPVLRRVAREEPER